MIHIVKKIDFLLFIENEKYVLDIFKFFNTEKIDSFLLSALMVLSLTL